MSGERTYDVVIVGSGITGAMMANKLSQRGLRVRLIEAASSPAFDVKTGRDERQPFLDRYYASTGRVPNSPYPNYTWANSPQTLSLGDYYYGTAYGNAGAPEPVPPKVPHGQYVEQSGTYTRVAGGTTYHWLGTSLRLVPNTFQEQSAYGVGVDWPMTYREMADWYTAAEVEIGVAGDENEDLGSPRYGAPYPMPRILPSYTDKVFAEKLDGMQFEGLPVRVGLTPQSRNSVPYQDRPPCAGSTNCVPICPIQAKYDATVHLKRALNPTLDPYDRAGSVAAEPTWEAVATRVEIDSSGRVSGIEYTRPDGTKDMARGTVYVLGLHAIETPKLLLMSASDQAGLQDGVANSSGAVGRYLMDQALVLCYGMGNESLDPLRGPLSTAGIESLRDGDFRRDRAAFRVEIEAIGAQWALNLPFGPLNEGLAANKIGRELWETVGWNTARSLQIDGEFEIEPQWDSRVSLARDSAGDFVRDALGVPRPRIDMAISDYTFRGIEAFQRLAQKIMARFGATPHYQRGDDGQITIQSPNHMMGTTRMGTDPSACVTDPNGRTYDHENLFILGSPLFPTSGTGNPTLTIAALTLRQVDAIAEAARQ